MNHSLLMIQSLSPEWEADSFFIPSNYTIKDHSECLVNSWCSIQCKADRYHSFSPELFETQFPIVEKRSKRIFYLCHNDVPIATAACWFGGKNYKNEVGRLHWVAVLPQYQGKGLGRVLVKEAKRRFAELQYKEVYLSTSTIRPVAVSLYLSEGFIPVVTPEFTKNDWLNYIKTEFGELFSHILSEI